VVSRSTTLRTVSLRFPSRRFRHYAPGCRLHTILSGSVVFYLPLLVPGILTATPHSVSHLTLAVFGCLDVAFWFTASAVFHRWFSSSVRWFRSWFDGRFMGSVAHICRVFSSRPLLSFSLPHFFAFTTCSAFSFLWVFSFSFSPYVRFSFSAASLFMSAAWVLLA